MLSCFGSRCCTSTKASPVSSGSAPSNCVNASNPPADAPIPTMGKDWLLARAAFARRAVVAGLSSAAVARFTFPAVVFRGTVFFKAMPADDAEAFHLYQSRLRRVPLNRAKEFPYPLRGLLAAR